MLAGTLLGAPATLFATNSLPRMMAISCVVAVLSGAVGLYASYYLDVASGAAIVLACTACFTAASAVRAARHRPTRKAQEVTAARKADVSKPEVQRERD